MNGIDIDEYFVEVVDEGGGTIDYAFNPSSNKCFLVNEIYEQNRQLQELKQENEELKEEIKDWIEQRKIAHNRYMKYQTKLEKIKTLCEREYMYDVQGYKLGDAIMEIIEGE